MPHAHSFLLSVPMIIFNTCETEIREWASWIGYGVDDLPMKYLGLPLVDDRLNLAAWDFLILRDSAWKIRYMSLGGRITLLKATLSNLVVYYFSLIKTTMLVISKLKKLMSNLFRSVIPEKRKFNLVKWSEVCLPKQDGGLGLRHCNEALNGLVVVEARNMESSFMEKVLFN
ncbi:hypothetical protein AMTRI_Chr09g21400 [Amborella trichopoda]